MGDTKCKARPAWVVVSIGIVIGALLALPALFIAIASGGAGHGDYVWARALFPLTMLLMLIEGTIGPIGITVSLLQFPFYGGLAGWTLTRRNYLAVGLAASIHLIAVVACFSGLLPP